MMIIMSFNDPIVYETHIMSTVDMFNSWTVTAARNTIGAMVETYSSFDTSYLVQSILFALSNVYDTNFKGKLDI